MIRQFYNYTTLLLFIIVISCSKDDSADQEALEVIIQTQDMNFNINENPEVNQVIGTVVASVNRGTILFSILEQPLNIAFDINSTTGELYVRNNSFFDYENIKEITGKIKISSSDSDVYEVSSITITINDVVGESYFGDVYLKNQEEVDEFSSKLYEEINGSLLIDDSNDFVITPITDLSGLASIKVVRDDLIISNSRSLINLEGLNNITNIGTLRLVNNHFLEDISALKKISTLANIDINYNPLITSLNCFLNIISLSGACNIVDSEGLLNLEGLNNITSIGGNLYLRGNDKLLNVSGLNSLTTVNGYFAITNHNKLSNLYDLGKLQRVQGGFSIGENHSLVNLEGLNSFKSLNNDLFIAANDSLLNLDGLHIEGELTGNIKILANESLLNIDALQSITSVDGSIFVENNLKLESIKGLLHIERLNRLLINNNDALTSLNGLDNLSSVITSFEVFKNGLLSDFCSLENLVQNSISPSLYDVAWNLYNPTIDDINNGECSN
ncbi:cadherin repeat domain-containing protein [Aquimarina addita]